MAGHFIYSSGPRGRGKVTRHFAEVFVVCVSDIFFSITARQPSTRWASSICREGAFYDVCILYTCDPFILLKVQQLTILWSKIKRWDVPFKYTKVSLVRQGHGRLSDYLTASGCDRPWPTLPVLAVDVLYPPPPPHNNIKHGRTLKRVVVLHLCHRQWRIWRNSAYDLKYASQRWLSLISLWLPFIFEGKNEQSELRLYCEADASTAITIKRCRSPAAYVIGVMIRV